MATVLILPLAEYGHVIPTFALARALREEGHRVVLGSTRDLEEPIRAEGFEFEPLFERFFPKGFREEVRTRMRTLGGAARRRYQRQVVSRWNGMYEAVLQGEFDRLIERVRPDLGLCDVLLSELTLCLYGHGVPVLQLNTSFPLEREPMSPPPTSHVIPGEGPLWRARWAMDWGRFALDVRFSALLQRLGWEGRALECRRQLARRHGYPEEELDAAGRLVVNERAPMLVLCPREFADFRGVQRSAAYFFTGPCVDLGRHEPELDWGRVSAEAPLILCSLGTMLQGSDTESRFFEAVLGAARQRPRWQLVLATGQRELPELRQRAPSNVVLLPYAPQLRLLRHAAAMVTHGGLNSVKECISLGVPMVAVPMMFDQPGVAARVAHHGLGVRTFISDLSEARLVEHLDEILQNPSYKKAVTSMGALFQRAESSGEVLRFLERFLLSTARRRTQKP